MKMQDKHKSKLHKGFLKQVARQECKPREVKIKLPTAINLPKNFKGTYKHFIKVSNSIWNGMNLVVLYNSFNTNKVGGMYGKFTITSEGKYKLSMYGKQLLKKKRAKKELKNKYTQNIKKKETVKSVTKKRI